VNSCQLLGYLFRIYGGKRPFLAQEANHIYTLLLLRHFMAAKKLVCTGLPTEPVTGQHQHCKKTSNSHEQDGLV
jgi:hypothetical protein